MYFIFGAENILQMLIKNVGLDKCHNNLNFNIINKAYSNYLALRTKTPTNYLSNTTLMIYDDCNEITDAALKELFNNNIPSPGDMNEFLEPAEIKKIILELYSLDYKLWLIFNIVIKNVFVTYTASIKSLSTDDFIGSIIINMKKKWSMQDYLEVLIHELAHNLTFLHCHDGDYFNFEQGKRENDYLIQSVIRKEKRPITKALDSLIVAVELLLFRKIHNKHNINLIAHPDSNTLLNSAKITCADLADNYFIMTDKGKQLIMKFNKILEQYSL